VPGTLQEGGAPFQTTHWTVVLQAGQAEVDESARKALATFSETYWPPLYTFVRRRGYSPADAQDIESKMTPGQGGARCTNGIYIRRYVFSPLPKSDCFQIPNFGDLIPTESWSFLSEKSYSPRRLINMLPAHDRSVFDGLQ
jgi:hypothetical protein